MLFSIYKPKPLYLVFGKLLTALKYKLFVRDKSDQKFEICQNQMKPEPENKNK